MRTRLALITLLAACGSVNPDPVDPDAPPPGPGEPDAAPPGPGEPDARPPGPGEPDAAPPTASIVFFDRGAPVPDAAALLFDADGAFLRETTTDASGVATFDDISGGSIITVGKRIGLGPVVATVYGIEPGDRIRVGDIAPVERTTVTVTVPAQTGVTRYAVGSGCGQIETVNAAASGATTIRVPALLSCKPDNMWTIVAVGQDSSFRPVKFSTTRISGTTATLSAWTDVTATSGFADFAASFTNTPPGTSSVSLNFEFPFPIGASASFSNLPAGNGSRTFRYPPGVVDALVYSVDAKDSSFENGTLVRRTLTPGPSDSINMGAVALPVPAALTAVFTNAARPALSWTAPPAASLDMVALHGAWSGQAFYNWFVYAPPGTASVTFPAIPTTHDQLIPPAPGGQQAFRGEVAYVKTVATGGWNVVRQEPVATAVRFRSYRVRTAP